MHQVQRANGWAVAALIFLVVDFSHTEPPQGIIDGAKKEGRVVFSSFWGSGLSLLPLHAAHDSDRGAFLGYLP
jgi:hypothetical protein